MNVDKDHLLDVAMGIISNVDSRVADRYDDEAWPLQHPEWREVARRWIDDYLQIPAGRRE